MIEKTNQIDVKAEVANSLTHGIGIILGIIGIPVLMALALRSDSLPALFGAGIYALSFLMVFTSSTLYHACFRADIKPILQVLDHISIYFLIAGSFTPFLLVYVQSESGSWVLISLWVMVTIGSVFKLFYTHKFKLISTLAYVGMGALSLFVIEPLQHNLPETSYIFLQVGLGSYLLGVPFYLWKSLYHNHLIWHVFVLGGSISHFVAAWLMI